MVIQMDSNLVLMKDIKSDLELADSFSLVNIVIREYLDGVVYD